MKKIEWLVITLIAASCPALAIDEAELAALLDDARTEMKMPGLRAAVRLADGRIVRAAVGLADREADTPLDDFIGMPGGSTGKTFVAALTLLLAEDGVLSLDDPAAKWLGDTAWYGRLPNAGSIRVRHLLSHSSGIRFRLQSRLLPLRISSLSRIPLPLQSLDSNGSRPPPWSAGPRCRIPHRSTPLRGPG